jgi:hypothetical protein
MDEPNKKKVKKEDNNEKINEIGKTIRNNNLKKDKDVVQTTYGEIMEKIKENKSVGPPAPQVKISPWLSTTIESDVHRPTIEFDDNN